MNASWPAKEYNQQIESMAKLLLSSQNIFTIAHPHPDGDSIGSQLALYHFCKLHNKKCTVLNFDLIPEQLAWLPGVEVCQPHLDNNCDYDLAFLMETTDVRRMGERANFFSRAKTSIHIDHHIAVTGLGELNLIDDRASSTCEILYNIFEKTALAIPTEALMAIYVGIMTDTGNFRYSNSTPRAHEIAAQIIKSGLDVDKIYSQVYEATHFKRVVLIGTIMARSELFSDGKILISSIYLKDFEQIEAEESDADGAIKNITSVKGVEVTLLLREEPNNYVKASLRSAGKIDVMHICKKFEGGGHKFAAGAKLKGSIKEVTQLLIAEINKDLFSDG